MTNWKEYKLGEIGHIITGKTPSSKNPEQWGNRMPFVTPTDFDTYNKNISSSIRYLSKEGIIAFQKKVLPVGTVIVTCIGSQMGKVALNKKECVTNQQINSIVPYSEFNSDYIYYVISSMQDYLRNLATGGSTMPIINKSNFEDITIKAPDLPTQTAIAEILSSLDDKIELNNKINQELETLAQTLFKQWFIDFEFPNEDGEPYKSSGGEMIDSELGEIPKGWELGVLDDLIDFSNGNAFKSSELLNEPENECYHVFKMGHIKKGGGLNADGTKSYFEKSKAQKLQKFVLRVGDLLMCMTDMKGNVALLGHTALMNENDKYIVNQRVGLLRPKNDIGIDYPYLYILTNSSAFIDELRSRANSGVQVNLSTSEIKLSKVLLPPKEINISFDKIVKPFYDSIFNSINENRELKTLRDTLLPKLISGELEVSELVAQNA